METETFHVSKAHGRKSLIEFVALSLNVSKKQAKRIIDSRSVYVNEKRVWIASHGLNAGDVVKVYAQGTKDTPPSISEKEIIYRDEHYLIVNKPPGILSNGAKSVEAHLRTLLKDRFIRAVHRLDKDTSGCLIFAFNDAAFEKAVVAFKEKTVSKKYLVLCVGSFRGERIIKTPIDGKEAITHVRFMKGQGDISLLEVRIETGRTHQIRKHLQSIGFPVLGDKEYTTKRSVADAYRHVKRQMLHASEIGFSHPYTARTIKVSAPIPSDFELLSQ